MSRNISGQRGRRAVLAACAVTLLADRAMAGIDFDEPNSNVKPTFCEFVTAPTPADATLDALPSVSVLLY